MSNPDESWSECERELEGANARIIELEQQIRYRCTALVAERDAANARAELAELKLKDFETIMDAAVNRAYDAESDLAEANARTAELIDQCNLERARAEAAERKLASAYAETHAACDYIRVETEQALVRAEAESAALRAELQTARDDWRKANTKFDEKWSECERLRDERDKATDALHQTMDRVTTLVAEAAALRADCADQIANAKADRTSLAAAHALLERCYQVLDDNECTDDPYPDLAAWRRAHLAAQPATKEAQ